MGIDYIVTTTRREVVRRGLTIQTSRCFRAATISVWRASLKWSTQPHEVRESSGRRDLVRAHRVIGTRNHLNVGGFDELVDVAFVLRRDVRDKQVGLKVVQGWVAEVVPLNALYK
jgi:hypothetical protein